MNNNGCASGFLVLIFFFVFGFSVAHKTLVNVEQGNYSLPGWLQK